jgi:cyclopropane-fatty-acyl-phospholipid synthase
MDARAAVQAVLSGADRPFGVRLWDGTVLPPVPHNGSPVLVLRQERVGAAFGIPPSEERLSEAFLSGDMEVEGDLIEFLERASGWKGPDHLPTAAVATGLVAEVGARATEFFRGAGRHSVIATGGGRRRMTWATTSFGLPRSATRSSAYFVPGGDLEAAQLAKLELVCAVSGPTWPALPDIGCGWRWSVTTRAFGVQPPVCLAPHGGWR